MALPEVFGVAQAAKLHYNPHARITGQPVWSESNEEGRAWWNDLTALDALLPALSPLPRPVAEEVLLQQLLTSLVIEELPKSADPVARERLIADEVTQREAALARLIPVMDWPVHVGGWDATRPTSLAFRLLDQAIAHGTFDMAFAALEPFLLPTDQAGRHCLAFSILMECEEGHQAARAIRTPLKRLASEDIQDYLMLWGMLQLTREEPQHYGAIQSWADSDRPLPAQLFRDLERAQLRKDLAYHDTPEQIERALEELDAQLTGMLTHPWLEEHHQRLYDAFRAVRPHVGEHLYLAEERQQHSLAHGPRTARHRRRSS